MVHLRRRGTQSNLFYSPKGARTSNDGNTDYSVNEVYSIGSDLEVQWATGLTSYEFVLYQQVLTFVGAKEGPVIYVSNVDTENPPDRTALQSFHWSTQLYDLNLPASNVFFLWARSNGRLLWTSDYFNISASAVSSSSSAPASTTFITSASVLPSTSSSSIPSATPTSSPEAAISTSGSALPSVRNLPSASDVRFDAATPTSSLAIQQATISAAAQTEINSSVKLGIGIGAGVGLCILIGICILGGYCLAKRRKSGRAASEGPPPPKYESGATRYAQKPLPAVNWHGSPRELGSPEPKEMSARFSAVELPHQRFSRM